MSKSEDYLKEKLSEAAEVTFEKPLGKLSNIELSNNLCRFFVEKIMPDLGHEDVADLFDDGLCDGSGDLGIDALIKVGGNVHIIQTKFVSFNNSFKRDWVDTFQTIFQRLANKNFDYSRNKRLSELLDEVNWMKDIFYVWLVTNVKFDNQSSLAIQNECVIPTSLDVQYGLNQTRINFEYYDQQKIYEVYASRPLTEEKQGADEVSIFSAKNGGSKRSEIIEIFENNYRSVMLVIESEQIAQVWRANKNKLFDYNIRNYLGENKKNREILLTAKQDPERFFLFNNGISAVCEHLDIDREKNKIAAKKFSVINGAQTVRTLAKLQEQSRQPKVMLRVTEIPHHKERNAFLHEVVRFNNTQNEIKSADFRSNDAIQVSIKQCFDKLIIKGGKKYEYFPKRVESTKKNIHEVKMTDFARANFDFMFNPYEVAGSGGSVMFDLSKPSPNNSYYEQIFGPENSYIGESDFREKAGIYFLSLLLDTWLKKERSILKKNPGDQSNIILNAIERKPILMMFVRLIFERLQKEVDGKFAYLKFLADLSLSKKSLDIFSDEDNQMIFLRKTFESIKNFAVYEYSRLIDDGMSHRKWIRGTDQLDEKLTKAIKNHPNLTLELKNYLFSH